jgi:hypothetical protein
MTADWESSHYNFFFWGEPFWGFCYGVIDDFRESVTQQRIVIWDGFETVERRERPAAAVRLNTSLTERRFPSSTSFSSFLFYYYYYF